MQKPLFFIALVPPEPLLGELVTLKQELAERYSAKAALRSPPHITLHMPFQWRETHMNRLISSLEERCSGVDPFQVRLHNIDAFPPRVIYLDVERDDELVRLQAGIRDLMKRKFNIFNGNYRDKPFHPHLTLLFRDLKKSEFQKAWGDMHTLSMDREWVVSDVCLLRHDGKQWDIFIRIPLKIPGL